MGVRSGAHITLTNGSSRMTQQTLLQPQTALKLFRDESLPICKSHDNNAAAIYKSVIPQLFIITVQVKFNGVLKVILASFVALHAPLWPFAACT